MMLYPLLFAPRYVEKIWGGRKLETVLGKTLPTPKPVGESWELFDFPPGVVDNSGKWVSATVTNGPLAGKSLHDLITSCGTDLTGSARLVGAHGQFPVLIKFLDAREDLSVQVHPPQKYADAHPGAHLKTEAWYVMQHEPDARLLIGLEPGATPDAFAKAITDNTVESMIKSIPAKVGDMHFLPSGTVHALGAGILAAEVQTPSDTTFRVYDFGRLENGTPRKLHITEAMECINFDQPAPTKQPRSHAASHFTTVTRLVTCEFFNIEKVRFSEGVDDKVPYDQPVVWMMLEGKAELRVKGLAEPVTLTAGQTVLLPAKMDEPRLKTLTDCTWLEVTFPTK